MFYKSTQIFPTIYQISRPDFHKENFLVECYHSVQSFLNKKITLMFDMQVITEIPYVLVQTSYYTLIVYAMVGFQWTATKFFWFFFVSFFSFLGQGTLGTFRRSVRHGPRNHDHSCLHRPRRAHRAGFLR